MRSVPGRVGAVTAVASQTAAAFGAIRGWPLWAIASAGLAVWLPLFVLETSSIGRHHGWLSLFFVLVITQGGHVVEHVVQMLQIHVLDRTGRT